MSSKLKDILSEIKWEGKSVELGKVYSNPYATAFKPQETIKEEEIKDCLLYTSDAADE